MSDEEETVYISEEEAANVLSGQIEIYQHIQDQALSVVRMLLAFIGITVAALSIFIAEYGISKESPLIHDMNMFNSFYEVLVFSTALAVIVVGSVRAVRDIHRSLKGAINLLSAPDLRPFSSKSIDMVVSGSSDIGGENQYENWIEHNQELINNRNIELSGVYQEVRGVAFELSYTIPLAFTAYFTPEMIFTFVPLIVALGIIKWLTRFTFFERFLAEVEDHKFGGEGVSYLTLVVLWIIVAMSVSWLTRFLP